MSNVLIGIIGVILFIGLALAGALFLGPRFQESQNNSTASALVQQASQVAQARAMFRVQEGREPTDASEAGLMPGYLKSAPINPTDSTKAFNVMDATGNFSTGDAAPGFLVIAGIGGDATRAAKICDAVSKQTGRTIAGPQEITSFSQIQGTVACIRPTATIGVVAPNLYVIAKV